MEALGSPQPYGFSYFAPRLWQIFFTHWNGIRHSNESSNSKSCLHLELGIAIDSITEENTIHSGILLTS
jgi:hypothetical protein